MQEGNELPYIRNIVMDEVHHYQLEPKSNTRKKGVNWLMKARKLISKNRPEDSDKEGYLWLFLDMFQKENKFSSGKVLLCKSAELLTWYC